MSGDPTPRLLAAAAALTGAAFLMVRTEPSWTGVLVGLACLALWALGTLAAKPGRHLVLDTPSRPMVLEAVIVETPRAKPDLLLPPPVRPTRLPEVPTYRQRTVMQRGRR